MELNSYGFPIETCSRCHGTGHHSYNQITGTICFKCDGTGSTITKQANPAWIAFNANYKAMKEVITKNLIVGAFYRCTCKGARKEVTSVVRTDEACGWQATNGVKTMHYFYIVAFADGTSETHSEHKLWTRRLTLADLNVEFYLAQIPTAKKVK